MPVKNRGARACILDVVAASVVNLWRLCPLDLTAAAYFLLTVTRTPVEASFAEAALLGPEVCMAVVRLGRHGIIGKPASASRNGPDQSVNFGKGGAITIQLFRLPELLQPGQRCQQ